MTRRQPAVLLDRAADWPQAAHEELLRAAIDIEKRHAGVYRLGDAERAGLREARTEIERREAAAEEGVAGHLRRAPSRCGTHRERGRDFPDAILSQVKPAPA